MNDNKNKKLAIIGANEPLLPYYKRARELGYTIYGFAWEEGAICKEYCDCFFAISFKEKDAILEICRALKIDGITSFSLESALPTVIYIARKLGLESNSMECLSLIQDKYTMRNCFRENQVSIPEYHLIFSSEEVENIDIPFPLIVKPVDNGGKKGVSLVHNFAELKTAVDYALENSLSLKALIEQYIDGKEFSVEYISYQGAHYFITITDKVNSGAPHFVELEHHQPAILSSLEQMKIRNIVEQALTSLKITSGASHTEVKMDKEGNVFVIEVGARMGGDFITSDLVFLSTGYDFTEGIIKLAINEFTPPVFDRNYFSGIYFLSKQTERIEKYVDSTQDYKEIVKSERNDIPLTYAENNSERSGYFIYQSDKSKFEI